MSRVSCYGCRHFRITHQPTRPYACRAFGFQSTRLPALDVMSSSGSPCRRREAQEGSKRSATP